MFQFENVKQLLIHFKEEQTCWDFLEYRFWKGKPVCPHCGSEIAYRIKEGHWFKCGNKKTCDKKFNVLTKTIFQGTKIPLSTWFAAIYLCINHKKGVSSCQLARDLGIQQRTAWYLLHRIGSMVIPQTDITLNDVVQLDETYVKGEAKNRSKFTRKLIADGLKEDKASIVLGMVNKDSVVMKVVPNTERNILNPIIKTHITDSETLLVTDMATYYIGLEDIYKGRITVNHSIQEYVVGEYHTNTIEGAFGLFKRYIFGTHHWVSAKHLQRYCTMFSYRYNTRKQKDCSRFNDVFESPNGRLRYIDLTAKIRPL